MLVKDIEQTRNLVTHFLLMTFLASLNMPCHASFVLNWHCLPSAIHGDGLKYWLFLVKCYASLRHWLTNRLYKKCTLRAQCNTLTKILSNKNNNAEYEDGHQRQKINAVS